jgi:hypothetical protein
MVNNKTYNNVVNFLCRIGQYHGQIASVSVGDIYDINLENAEVSFVAHQSNFSTDWRF